MKAETASLAPSSPSASAVPLKIVEPGWRPFAFEGRFMLADGTVRALKWVGVLLMTLDHINKYLYAERWGVIFDLGRIVMPVFGFVLAFNLARPDALARGVHRRLMVRLIVWGLIATPVVIALNQTFGLRYPWWPLNILLTLSAVVAIIYLIELGGLARYVLAGLLGLSAGPVVEFFWFGIAVCLGAWFFCRKATLPRFVAWSSAVLSLSIVNGNAWAMMSIALILLINRLEFRLPRSKWFFYTYYPLHLVALLAVKQF